MCDLYISGDDSPPTLSTESVFEATKEVTKWKELCSSSCGFKIPRAKFDEIEGDQQLSTAKERKKAAISFWLKHDPAPSWRRLIVGLDEIEAFEVAEKIRKYAEPLRGNVTKPIILYLYYMLIVLTKSKNIKYFMSMMYYPLGYLTSVLGTKAVESTSLTIKSY